MGRPAKASPHLKRCHAAAVRLLKILKAWPHRPGALQIAYGEENFEADYRCVLTSSPHSRDDVITSSRADVITSSRLMLASSPSPNRMLTSSPHHLTSSLDVHRAAIKQAGATTSAPAGGGRAAAGAQPRTLPPSSPRPVCFIREPSY